MKERSGWNKLLIESLQNKRDLSQLSSKAREELKWAESQELSRRRLLDGYTDRKMAAAGDDIGL